jgi:phage gp45-like
MNTGLVRIIRQIFSKLLNLIKRGYVSNFIADDLPHPIVQVSYLGKVGNAEVILPYGFAAGLPDETPVIVLSVLGNESNRICIPYSHFTRFKNQHQGEVQIGNEVTKSYIKFTKNGNIEIKTDVKIKVTAPEIEIDGDLNLTVNGNVTMDAGSGTVDIGAGQVNLGSGGAKIARLGDQVTVGGSTGTITSAGTNTSI